MEFVSHMSFQRQQGLALLYALLALIALALASITLVRSASTGSMLIGNLGFQQEATAASDAAAQAALTLLNAQLSSSSTSLNKSSATLGYYAYSDDLIDVTGNQLASTSRKLIAWDSDFCSSQSGYASCSFQPVTLTSVNNTSLNGNVASYVVFRLCDREGDPTSDTTINCARPLAGSSVSSVNEARDYSTGAGTTASEVSPYYRIVVRVVGARHSTSYVETIAHF